MSAVRFICPHCGYKAQYSREILFRIGSIVCNYYGYNAEEILGRWNKKDGYDGAKNLTVYFTRAMTGEIFKLIGSDLGLSSTRIGNMIFRVEDRMDQDKGYASQVDHIRKILIRELAPDTITLKDPELCLTPTK